MLSVFRQIYLKFVLIFWYKLENIPKIRKYCDVLNSLNSENNVTEYFLGWTYYWEKDYSKGLELFARYLRKNKNASTFYYVGLGYWYLRDYTGAIKYFKESLRMKPRKALRRKLLFKIGMSYALIGFDEIKSGNENSGVAFVEESLRHFDEYLAKSPKNIQELEFIVSTAASIKDKKREKVASELILALGKKEKA